MGDNYGSITVHLPKGVDRADVIRAITASYLRRGARPGPGGFRADLGALTIKKPGRTEPGTLGVAISPVDDGRVAIIDSEKYQADAALARDIASSLATTAFWTFVGDISLSELRWRFGVRSKAHADDGPSKFDFDMRRYHDAADFKESGWTFLTFEGVAPDSYEDAPVELPRPELMCSACDEDFVWDLFDRSTGGPELNACAFERTDSQAATEKEISELRPFLPLHPRPGPEQRILCAVQCPQCERSAAWADCVVAEGNVVRVTPLQRRPKDVSGFQYQYGPVFPSDDAGAGRARQAYAIVTGAESNFEGRVLEQSFPDALARLIAADRTAFLVFVTGKKGKGRTLTNTTVTARFSRSDVFYAWVRAALKALNDPAKAEAVLRDAREEDWTAAQQMAGSALLGILYQLPGELDRTAAITAKDVGAALSTRALFDRVSGGDEAAAGRLELAATRDRNIMLWRYARAVADGKPAAVTEMYKQRLVVG